MDIETKTREEAKREFLARLESLYHDLRTWALRRDPDAQVTTGEMTMSEEYVGKYVAPTLTIQCSSGTAVKFIPKGCNVVGAEGRVDVKSVFGGERLVYLKDNAPLFVLSFEEETDSSSAPTEGWGWTDTRPTGIYPALTEKIFARIMGRLGR